MSSEEALSGFEHTETVSRVEAAPRLIRDGDNDSMSPGMDDSVGSGLDRFLQDLERRGILVQKAKGHTLPPEAMMHDRAAAIPLVVISPRSEWGVQQVLKSLKQLGIYDKLPISIKSGGHGYFNGASCAGIMINLAGMTNRRIFNNVLYVEPGCMLGQIINTLAKSRKAVPHGDCFGVGAGGHFLTAGWDLILARRYGLGCQSVIGGRVTLWDGSTVEVDESNYPDLLHAMRGGAAAGVGIVTELRLRLIDEPVLATWRFTSLSRAQLETCVAREVFRKSFALPNDISVSLRFHFEPSQYEPVCSLNIVSLLGAEKTIASIRNHLGDEVASMVSCLSGWNEKSLINLRMLPASEFLSENPEMLAEISPLELKERPLNYWKPTVTNRGMARSFFTSISHWVIPECEEIFCNIYAAFQSVQDKSMRERMYALIIQGGGKMTELQPSCSMPLGQALARFEVHWDDAQDEHLCRSFTESISEILQSRTDPSPGRPYRGDIWMEDQGTDVYLESIFAEHDRRFA